VLSGIDLDVPEGTVFALLGPNGAGKTTTVHILSTLIGADGGEVRVAGHDLARDPDSVREVIGVTGQFAAVDNLLTGEENLILMADLRHLDRAEGRRRAAELLDQFDLAESARKPAATYSGGMRRRLDLVAGGVTIFLTTQYLEEADELADRIALLEPRPAGRRGHPGRGQAAHPRWPRPPAVRLRGRARDGRPHPGESVRDDEALTLQVPSDGSVKSLRDLLDRLDDASIEVSELSIHTPDLDDVFLTLTGQPDKEKELAR
jgi:ABC-2 type transport system ATP-binding protein